MFMVCYCVPDRKEKEEAVELPALVWSVLYYLGLFAGIYVLTAIGFLLFARLEKDKDGSLFVDPESLHYRACKKCYGWKMHCSPVKISHIEYYQIGICGYFWRVFWAFILLPIGYAIVGLFQTVKAVIYAPFMFLFGYYPWPTIQSMGDDALLAVEMKRISFPRVGKLELKPYLVVFPILYGWLFWSYPQTTQQWTLIAFVVALVIAACFMAVVVKEKVSEPKNPRVMLVLEHMKASKQGICPLLKVKT